MQNSSLISLVFNYMFIFGKFGAPQLGVVGVALGTIIARAVEVIVLILILIFTKKTFKSFFQNTQIVFIEIVVYI